MSSFLRSLITDLRERQVLPAMILLVVLAIAIPVAAAVFLSSSSAPGPVSVPPVDTTTPAGAPPLSQETAAINSAPPQKSVVYTGAEADPFRSAPKSSTHSSSQHSSTSTGSTSATGATSTTGSTHSGSTTGSKPPTSSTPPTGVTARLADDQAYTVDFATTDASVAATVKNAERVAPLPASAPQIVYIGVLRGGAKAVFVVLSPSASLATSGTAHCFPDAGDCEVLELATGASVTLPDAATNSTYKLEVSSITAKTYGSDAAAAKARRSASKAGEQLVSAAHPKALANFFYALGIGVVVHRSSSS